MPYDLGATARLTAECRDPGGTLTTAATAVLTIGLPDGTTATPAVEETATGQYQADYPTVQAGRHTVRWLFTGPGAAYTDSFDVRDAVPPSILSLSDAMDHLNKKSAADREEVRFWVEATTRAVEWFVGPVVVRTVTEVHPVRLVEALALRQAPALSLTSVTAVLSGGTSYDVGDLDLDESTGIVRLRAGGCFTGPLRVDYMAGRRVIAANITAAARIILQHLWRTQQGPGRPQMGVGDFDVTEPIPGLGYAIPNRAVQLLSPDQLPPGLA